MTKRGYIRVFSFSTALICTLLAVALINMTNAKNYKMQLEASYQQSLNELSESLDLIETNLTKGLYSGSNKMLTEISSDLYTECNQAKEALSRLPVSHMNLSSTYKFISQASDYANYLATKANSGEEISYKEHQNLTKLLSYSKKLNEAVSSMASVCNNGGTISNNVKLKNEIQINPISTDFDTAEEAFKDYPTLLYDGPFADAVLNKKPEVLKDKDTYTKEQALKVACEALDKTENAISYDGYQKGNIPCYTFTCGQRTIGITRQGGYVAYILFGGKISSSTIDEKNAVNIGKSYLNKLGYENMVETYYMVENNICTINYAYTANNVTCYSDLIKVGVSMSNGKIVSLEAEGYLTNHTSRKAFTPKINVKTAEKKLNSYLDILDYRLCVIPNENGTESKCYEFHCESKETHDELLIYINTDNAQEENILLLLYLDGGTLTK